MFHHYEYRRTVRASMPMNEEILEVFILRRNGGLTFTLDQICLGRSGGLLSWSFSYPIPNPAQACEFLFCLLEPLYQLGT